MQISYFQGHFSTWKSAKFFNKYISFVEKRWNNNFSDINVHFVGIRGMEKSSFLDQYIFQSYTRGPHFLWKFMQVKFVIVKTLQLGDPLWFRSNVETGILMLKAV